jgi:mannobiose 2-epimerase
MEDMTVQNRKTAEAAVLGTLRDDAMACLTRNILPFWLENMQDRERGGWYGRMTGDGHLQKDAPRGAILYARLLWTMSAAYRVLADRACLEAATMTKRYILEHFLDREHGGTYWSLTADGQPLDTKKQFYAQGFMLYGFSEYARATGDGEALQTALQLYGLIERHAWDSRYGGYTEACTRQWQPIADMRLSAKDENYPKSQNTHLHIIEPYTNLLRCLSERGQADDARSALQASVRRLITLFTTRILRPETFHLDLFFDMDWTRKSTTESYGHDIECSWLLHEAALVLADPDVLSQVEPIVRKVAKASEKGLQPDGSMAYESGDNDRHWWVQAEAVVGFLNLYQHFGDRAALQKALRLWEYVKANLIDHNRGEWYWSIRADGSVNLDDDHAGFWKCPYHNGRMCLEILERLEP